MSHLRLCPRSPGARLAHLLAASFGLALPCAAQAPQWVHQFGSGASDVEAFMPSGAAPDGAGGAFVCGTTDGNLAAPNAGGSDAWVARMDGAGTKLWVVQHGGPLFERLYAAASDGAGGVYVAGANGDVWPATGDAWVERLDAAGAILWERVLGTPQSDTVLGAAPDGAQGVFVCGETGGDLAGPNAGGADAWVARLDASGALAWSLQLGTGTNESATSVALDGSGGLYLCGKTMGALGGPNQGLYDVWLARLDGAGGLIWLRQYGGQHTDQATAVVAVQGGAFLAGHTQGSFAGPHQGGYDAWLAFVDDAGVRRWSTQVGLVVDDLAQDLCPDGVGGVWVAGSTGGGLWGAHKGFDDAWVARYDAFGKRLWGHQLGSSKHESAEALAADGTGGVFVYGWTHGLLGAQNQGAEDPWIARY